MVAVYDFPEWSVGGDDHLVPELVVDHIAGTRVRLTGRPRGVGATGQPLGGPCFWRGTGLSAWSRRDGGHARDQQLSRPRTGRGRAVTCGGLSLHPEITVLRAHTSGSCAKGR